MRKIHLSLLFTLFSSSLLAYTDPVSGVKYETNSDGTAKVASNNYGRNLKTANVVVLSDFSEGGKNYTVTELSTNAFGNSAYAIAGGGDYSIRSVQIPETVTIIGSCAFAYCYNLTSVNLPSNLTKLGSGAFAHCENLSSEINIPASVSIIERTSFSFCEKITSVNISEGIKEIGDEAFRNTGIKKISIPNSVDKVGSSAFYGCGNLQEVTLPTGLKTITGALFQNSGLLSISIPSGVTEIQQYAFYGCQSLTSIQMPKDLTKIGNFAFYNCKSLTDLFIPKGVESIGNWIVDGCESLKSISVEDGNLKYDSRENCNAIIETASNTLKTGCMATQIPSTVESIGEYAFSRCISLDKIVIPGNVRSIADNAFQACENLITIKMEEGVEHIGGLSFENCKNLKTLILPSTISKIGYGAFSHCKLESVTSYIKEPFELYQGTFITKWTETIYDNGSIGYSNSYDVDATLYVPAGSKNTYEVTNGWNLFKKIVELDGETAIRNVSNHIENTSEFFSLSGMKRKQNQKGIFIRRGKKSVIRNHEEQIPD